MFFITAPHRRMINTSTSERYFSKQCFFASDIFFTQQLKIILRSNHLYFADGIFNGWYHWFASGGRVTHRSICGSWIVAIMARGRLFVFLLSFAAAKIDPSDIARGEIRSCSG